MEKMNFLSYLDANYPLLLIASYEEERVIAELSKQAEGYNCFHWDIVDGFRNCNGQKTQDCNNPVEALSIAISLEISSVVFFKDFHRFTDELEFCRTTKSIIAELKKRDIHIVFLAPKINIPIELEKDITVIDFPLPDINELITVAQKLIDSNPELNLTIDSNIIAGARGLTLMEAENSFARSIITAKAFDREILETEKLQIVKKSGLMEIYPAESINNVGGLKPLKKYIESRKRGFFDAKLPTPHGILLAGLPGSGKSLAAKAIASVLGMPLIRLDLGTLKGSLVGQSEENMKKACNMIDAISPCVVWLDEIEKSLAGVTGSAGTDSGTSANMFGQLLTWMQESKAQKYIVATCNDIDDLLSLSQGALIRRFDDIFFVDLPNNQEKQEILAIMKRKYNAESLDCSGASMDKWTGAEIEKFIINALYDGVGAAAKNIRPIAIQNQIKIDKAREWAKYNAIWANEQESEPITTIGRKLKV